MELIERADNYAAGKANEAITKAIAQAYKDGYHDGYNDCKEEIPVNLRDNRAKCIDLGLPSGTLWSNDYERKDGEIIYLPYCKAAKENIPTEEQWKELTKFCRRKFDTSSSGMTLFGVTFIGPNGNSITFESKGFMKDNLIVNAPHYGGGKVYFWITDQESELEKKSIQMDYFQDAKGSIEKIEINNIFSGYKLPLRLVR